MKPRKTILWIIAALIGMLLCSCSNGGSENEATETTNYAQIITTPVTEEVKPTELSADSYVVTAKEKTYQYSDSSGTSLSATYRIPALNFSTAEAAAVNAEIEQAYAEEFLGADKAEQEKTALPCDMIDYEYYINDKLISIVIKHQNSAHITDYRVYNYNAENDTRLDNGGLLAYLNRDTEQTYSDLKKVLQDDYTSKYKYDHFPKDYYIQLEKTIGDEGLKSSQLYLRKNANLCAICTEYASVGQKVMQVMISID